MRNIKTFESYTSHQLHPLLKKGEMKNVFSRLENSIKDEINTLTTSILHQDIKYALNANYKIKKECENGTAADIIDKFTVDKFIQEVSNLKFNDTIAIKYENITTDFLKILNDNKELIHKLIYHWREYSYYEFEYNIECGNMQNLEDKGYVRLKC